MAIEYIGTPDIKVFPSAFRNGDEEAKRTTEENLIKLNRLSGNTENLNQMFEDPDDSGYLIFNIHGYWFRCLRTKMTNIITALGATKIYAFIKLEKVAKVGWRLSARDEGALDDGTYFKGLSFTLDLNEILPEEDAITKYYYLQVTDSAGELLYQKLKLDSTEIRNGDSTKSISEEFNTDKINFPNQNKVHLQENGTTLLSTFSYGKNANNVTPEGKNVFVGNAGNTHMGSTATSPYESSNNTAMGYDALYSNTKGFNNTAIGYSALYANTEGYQNTAIGYDALYSNTTGFNNTAIGYSALYANTTGYFNTALGYVAGRYLANGVTAKTTGGNSVFIGHNSKASADGVNNEIVIGSTAVGKGANTVALGNSYVTKAYVGDSELAKKSEVDSLVTAIENGITKVLRTRSPSTSLTSVGLGDTTTGNSIAVSSSLSQGDTIMIEVSDYYSASLTPKILFVTLGSASTAPNSTGHGDITSWTTSNGSTTNIYSFTVTHNGSTLYFGSRKKMSGTISGTTMSWSTSNYVLYVGKVWKV